MKKFFITIVTTVLVTLGVSFHDVEASPASDKQVMVSNNNGVNGDGGRGGRNNLTRTAVTNNGDNDVDYGWLGLLGLIGLAGARGRNREKA